VYVSLLDGRKLIVYEFRFTERQVTLPMMFDEDLFNVFNEASSSAEKSGSQRESGSSRDADTVSKHRDTKGGGFEKTDNKRYERYCLKQLKWKTAYGVMGEVKCRRAKGVCTMRY